MNARLAPAAWVAAWVGLMARHARVVVVFGVILTIVAGAYAATHLSMDTDNADMISAQVDWRQDYLAYEREFPVYTDNLVLVVDGASAQVAASATKKLANALRDEPALFPGVYVPGGGKFFARNGLLYLDTPVLERLADRLTRIQPFLGRLAAEPTLPTFFSLLDQAMAPDAPTDFDLAPVFRQLNGVFEASRAQVFHRLSWQALMGGADTPGASTQRFIIVAPKLDYASILPAARPMARVDELASQLDLDDAHGVQVRQTGEVALADEELASVSRGAAWGAPLALALVGLILYLGLRSWRLMAAALASLIAGLVGTAAFAAFAVGTLNLISIAFAVLYIGLGIDYAIHLCLRYRAALGTSPDGPSALRSAAGDVGTSLLLCAVTTAAGFFAFIPTPYSGVAELGLISGTGMFISLIVSLTFLPALIALMPAAWVPVLAAPATNRARRLAQGPRSRRGIRIGTCVLALACAGALPFVHFDSNTLNLKDPTSESVTTYRELLAESDDSPLTLVTTRPTRDAANRLAQRLAERPEVARALTIDDFVPSDQNAKLAIIGDLALTLALAPPDTSQHASPDEQRRALGRFADALDDWRAQADDGEAADAAGPLAASLAAWQSWFDGLSGERRQSALSDLRASILSGLAPQIEQLTQSMQAQRLTRDSLPETLSRRWIGTEGAYRVEASAAGDLTQPRVLRAFVAGAQEVAPDITGPPVVEVSAGRTVSRAFVTAFAYAAVFITLLLLILLRSVRDTLRVLAPLALTGLILSAASVWLGIAFNFANVIALPLLLGVGVDSGIHVLHRLRADNRGAFMASSTARAVVLSSLTTLVGFGSLAFSHHAGTASMGQLLAIGMVAILVTTLVVLPALFDSNTTGENRHDDA